MQRLFGLWILILVIATACTLEEGGNGNSTGGGSTGGNVPNGETGRVVRVADGDTITVEINGEEFRVRYIGINTPELARSGNPAQPCAEDATQAHRDLVDGEIVTLVKDISETDRFDRLLRYVYVGDLFVNEWLIENGWAESTRYPPDTAFFERFSDLEQSAAAANRGCHPTGIFDDGTDTR